MQQRTDKYQKSRSYCNRETNEDNDEDCIAQACCHYDCDNLNGLGKCDKCQKLFCKANHIVITGDEKNLFSV